MNEPKLRDALSRMQGQLFELSGKAGYGSEEFIKAFMGSSIAKGLDDDFDYMQWAGKEYILEKMVEEYPKGCVKDGEIYADESLYWMGYVYRYWHYSTGESSKAIYKIANAKTMNAVYLGFHVLDVEEAIERLKEARIK